MAGLKNIKIKIGSVKKTGKVTRAMEAVSAVKMRKSQLRALAARPYALSALSVLSRVSGTTDLKTYPLGQSRIGVNPAGQAYKTAVVVVTSDKGLAGALNGSVLKAAERTLTTKNFLQKIRYLSVLESAAQNILRTAATRCVFVKKT